MSESQLPETGKLIDPPYISQRFEFNEADKAELARRYGKPTDKTTTTA